MPILDQLLEAEQASAKGVLVTRDPLTWQGRPLVSAESGDDHGFSFANASLNEIREELQTQAKKQGWDLSSERTDSKKATLRCRAGIEYVHSCSISLLHRFHEPSPYMSTPVAPFSSHVRLLSARSYREVERIAPGETGHRFTSTQRLGTCGAHVYLRRSKKKGEHPWRVKTVEWTHNHPVAEDPRVRPLRLTQEDKEQAFQACGCTFYLLRSSLLLSGHVCALSHTHTHVVYGCRCCSAVGGRRNEQQIVAARTTHCTHPHYRVSLVRSASVPWCWSQSLVLY
jgi:hypothetical protein